MQLFLNLSHNIGNTHFKKPVTCNGFKESLQSLHKVESSSTAGITGCNFLCNLCCNGVARKLHVGLACNTLSLQLVSQLFLGLQQLHKVELGSTFCSDCMEFVLNKLQVPARGYTV